MNASGFLPNRASCLTSLVHRWLPAVAALGLATAALAASGENWPQWRGPHFNGSAKASGLPANLGPDTLLWHTPLPGKAGSTPVIWGDKVFVTSPDEARNLSVICLDRKTGARLWARDIGVPDREKARNNLSAPSPVTDGQRVIALFASADLAAWDLDGKPLWTRALHKDFGRFGVMWMYGSSPLLYEGRLYVQVLQRGEVPSDYPLYDGKPERESFLLCLDPADGHTIWRHVRKTDSTKESSEAYSTPIPYVGKNGAEVLVVGGDHVSGHRLTDGAENWRARLYEKRDDWYRIVTSPVAGDGLIYASGPKGQPVVAFRDGAKGDVTGQAVAWEFKENPTDWSTPLLMDGKLFVLDGGKKVLSRLDPKTGEKKWSGKLPVREVVWGSPTGADGKIYLHSEEGTVVVCDAGDEFKVLGTYLLGDGDEGPCKGSVAVAQGQVFVRGAKTLYSFGTKTSK